MSNKRTITTLLGGLAGAVAVTLLNETLRKTRLQEDAPQLQKLGMDAGKKILKKAGADVPSEEKLYWGTMLGDLVANTLYYAAAAGGQSKAARTTAMGLLAGIGGVVLPKTLGLKTAPSGLNAKRKLLTTAYYLVGAWVAGIVTHKLTEVTGE